MSDTNTNGSTGTTGETNKSDTGKVADANKEASTFSSADLTKLVNDQVSSKIKEVETKAVDKITSKIVSSLKGEEEDENVIHTALIQKPEALISSIIEKAKTDATDSMREEIRIRTEIDEALAPVFNEFPDLKKVRRELLAEFGNTDPRLAHGKRAIEAANNIAKRMGWKSESEKKTDKETDSATMSPFSNGGYSSSRPEMQGAVKTLNDSAKSFFKKRNEQFQGYRSKEASK